VQNHALHSRQEPDTQMAVSGRSVVVSALLHAVIHQRRGEYEFSEIEQKRGPEARTSGPWTLHTYSAYYDCPGARIDVSPALRITSMLSSALNSGVVLTARRCPRLAAANAAAPAVALSGAS
jgi:hypothetical protein